MTWSQSLIVLVSFMALTELVVRLTRRFWETRWFTYVAGVCLAIGVRGMWDPGLDRFPIRGGDAAIAAPWSVVALMSFYLVLIGVGARVGGEMLRDWRRRVNAPPPPVRQE